LNCPGCLAELAPLEQIILGMRPLIGDAGRCLECGTFLLLALNGFVAVPRAFWERLLHPYALQAFDQRREIHLAARRRRLGRTIT
jgi:hypothetical protein